MSPVEPLQLLSVTNLPFVTSDQPHLGKLQVNTDYCNDSMCSKIRTKRLNHSVMHPNGEDRMANSVDPDQTAPLGAV